MSVIDLVRIFESVSLFAIPVFIFIILGYGHLKGVAVYETFVEGAKEGFTTAVRVIPYLVAMFVAIGILRASGAMDMIIDLISPLVKWIGIPPEVLPLGLIRPMSGMASMGMLAELLKIHHPDSLIGRTASTMMGSTETTLYTISVYFGSVGIKRIRYTLAAALTADFAGMVSAILISKILFG